MDNWKSELIQISKAKETRRLWRWTPLPPLEVLMECMKTRSCSTCHGPVGPFIFIGKIPNGPYMAFSRPIQLVRNGTTGLVLIPKEFAPKQEPVSQVFTKDIKISNVIPFQRPVRKPKKTPKVIAAKKAKIKAKAPAKVKVKSPAKIAVKTPQKKPAKPVKKSKR